MRAVHLLLILAVIPSRPLCAQTPAAPRYAITDLSALGSGGTATLWSIAMPGSAGDVTAVSGESRSVSFLANTLTLLKPVPGSQGSGSARGINDAGDIVGSYGAADGVNHAYLVKSGLASDLHGTVSLGGAESLAAAINNTGDIAGASTDSTGLRHAFVLRNGTLTDLDPLVTLGGAWSEASGINDAGDLVGTVQAADGTCLHAFLISGADSKVTDLHAAVRLGGCSSRAHGIDSKGEIVGSAATDDSSWHAFLYANGTSADLNTAIPGDSGWVLESAFGINEDGQIVGVGRYMGQRRAFQLKPLVAAAQAEGPVSVAQLTAAPNNYLNQRFAVRGKVQIIVLYGLYPCLPSDTNCSPILGISVFLQDLENPSQKLPIYSGGDPFRCTHDSQGHYSCGDLSNNATAVLTAVFSTGKEPGLIVGSASPGGGGGAPQVITFKDFYYLDLGPSH